MLIFAFYDENGKTSLESRSFFLIISKFYIPLSFPLSSWITLDLPDIMIGYTIIASIIINYLYSG